MQILYNTVISQDAPNLKNALWLKPVEGGFAFYALFNGQWQPLKLVDDGGTASTIDDVVQDLVGKNTDEKNDDTIWGAKVYAKDQADTLLGTDQDEATDMTLYGLKAYIDSKV